MSYPLSPLSPPQHAPFMDWNRRLPPISELASHVESRQPNTPPRTPHEWGPATGFRKKRNISEVEDSSYDTREYESKRLKAISPSYGPDRLVQQDVKPQNTSQLYASSYPYARSLPPPPPPPPGVPVEQGAYARIITESPRSERNAVAESSQATRDPPPTESLQPPPPAHSPRANSLPNISRRLPPISSSYFSTHRSVPELSRVESRESAPERSFNDAPVYESRPREPALPPSSTHAVPERRLSQPGLRVDTSPGSLDTRTYKTPSGSDDYSHRYRTSESVRYERLDEPERQRSSRSYESYDTSRSARQTIATPASSAYSQSSLSSAEHSAMPQQLPPDQLNSRYHYMWEVPGVQGIQPHRKRRGNLPKECTSILNDWFARHYSYPYPKEEEKQQLQAQTGLSMSQISNWFINARRRRRPGILSRKGAAGALEEQPP